MTDEEKVKLLCDKKICASMGEARRIVMQGAFDRWMKKFSEKDVNRQT